MDETTVRVCEYADSGPYSYWSSLRDGEEPGRDGFGDVPQVFAVPAELWTEYAEASARESAARDAIDAYVHQGPGLTANEEGR